MQHPYKQDAYSQMPGTYQQPSSLGEGNSRPPVTAVPQERVRDYLGVSIANLVCCCLPLGLAALLYSIQTRDALARRDTDSAARYSQTAFRLNIAAFVFGIVILICCIVYVVCFPNNSIHDYSK
ncbi:hypothetical protein XENTR_v10019722 [Xenopus tropicalis]|uniref:Dispanin subfamily A member 2b-like n=1 Tax=Xenopus tropicalis TaxID=8364 RepID=A0A8J1JVQ5_XENTR|nr:dispanin subfamily A member 2b-like [Xenopus tropicalis]KAE8594627.1 hypothetical protein XENTR_v10019722 [Xenopus tropicalis]